MHRQHAERHVGQAGQAQVGSGSGFRPRPSLDASVASIATTTTAITISAATTTIDDNSDTNNKKT